MIRFVVSAVIVALLASQQHNVETFCVSKQPAILRNSFSSTRLNAVSSVWVQIVYEGNNEPNGNPVEIEPAPKNIGALVKQVVKEELKKELDHAGLTEISVFPPDTTLRFPQDMAKGNQKRYKPGKPLEEVIVELKNTTPPTSDDHPLIVVAPAPQQQPANAASLSQWRLIPDEQVNGWRNWAGEKAAQQKQLPDEPFLIENDDRPRYELTGRFVVRKCFDSFEKKLQEVSDAAKENKRIVAISVLGVKGGGKSVFFRYYCSKYCSERLVLYVPDAAPDINQMYGKMMRGLIFGLQCLNTPEAQDFLDEVRALPVQGDIDMFYTLWNQWILDPNGLCRNAIIVIDQLEREGGLFQKLCRNPYKCGAYILVSSTGILHHHNVLKVFAQLTYSYPVSPEELSSIDTKNKLKGSIPTMLYAVGQLEDNSALNQTESNIQAALKHFLRTERKGLLQKLLALVQSEELQEPIDGIVWEEVTDPNYLWIEHDKMVKSPFPEYMDALRSLLEQGQVAYKATLMALLSSENIVREVGYAALGVHIEALLDLSWRENQAIGWSQEKVLGNVMQTSQSQAGGKEFKNFTTIDFYGNLPEETDLKEVNWDMPVYFKPKRTNYPGFDMFVLEKDRAQCIMHAMQVTVKNAKNHGVEAFDENCMSAWNRLVKKGANCTSVEWRFYMLTPERHPGRECPKSAFSDIPIFQVDFRDLMPSDQKSCGIKIAKQFPDLLDSKRQSQVAELQEREKGANKANQLDGN